MSESKNAQKCPEGNIGKPLDKIEKKNYRSRKLVFTSFDETEPYHNFDKDEIIDNQAKFLIYGREITPSTGKKHFQGFVYFYEKISIAKAKKYLKIDKGWFQYAFADIDANITYCSKDGDFTVHGTKPMQGKRTDIIEDKNRIMNGEISVDEILLEDPIKYHQYGRTYEKIEDLYMRRQWRTEMTRGIWYYGATGTGKSHVAYKDYDHTTHYDLINDNGWWDGYKQQEIVVINDYRGWIPYDRLLTLCDKWPTKVRRRNREPLPFMSKTIIITSSLPPDEVYNNRNENDKIEQLLRRFKVVEVTKQNQLFT